MYGVDYNFGRAKAFMIFTEKGILNKNWIVWVFGIVCAFGM